jgi:signal peptidase I
MSLPQRLGPDDPGRAQLGPGRRGVVPEGLPGAGTRLAAGLVLVLGDNTAASIDSRHFGPLPLSGVLGRVELPGPPRSPSA